jgi:predicted kinase
MERHLILFRGAPGAGKTTLAKAIGNYLAPIEADDWRNYEKPYDKAQNVKAHTWCKLETERWMLADSQLLVVANTFVKKETLQPYIDVAKEYGYKVTVFHVRGDFLSVHHVPQYVVDKMKKDHEVYTGEHTVFMKPYEIKGAVDFVTSVMKQQGADL